MSFEPGQSVGDYEILAVLGAGGMGKVYKVQHKISERVEAMKELLPDLSATEEAASRFLKEIRVQASLEHPNIAQLRTAFRVETQLLMVMEYVDGRPLDTYLENGQPIPTQHAAWFAIQVLQALEYAHSRGVVHRDIKPSNMMLTEKGIIKLLDFGIARAATDISQTQTRTTAGSLHYMSPEQIKGDAADARADLYALGISLYQMVTGRRPYSGDSEYALMAAHMHQMPVPPMQLNPSIGQYLNDIILTAIAKDSAARFQTAASFKQALEAYYRQQNFSHQQPQFTSSGDIKAPTPNGPYPAAQPAPTMQTAARQAVPSGVHASGQMPATPAKGSGAGAFIGVGVGLVLLVVVMAAGGYYFLKNRQQDAGGSGAATGSSTPASASGTGTSSTATSSGVGNPTGGANPAGTSASSAGTSATTTGSGANAGKGSTSSSAGNSTAGTSGSAASSGTAGAAAGKPTGTTTGTATGSTTGSTTASTTGAATGVGASGQTAASSGGVAASPNGGGPVAGNSGSQTANSSGAATANAGAASNSGAATTAGTGPNSGAGSGGAANGVPSLRELRREKDSLAAKLSACQAAFESLRKSQEAQGLRPNPKFQSALVFAQSQISSGEEALRRNAGAEAKEALDAARQVIRGLERDLGI